MFPKLFKTVRKNCFSNREKLLKFEAEGQEFSKILRSPEQFFRTMKDHRSDQLLKQNALLTCSWRFHRSNILVQLKFKLKKKVGI